MTGDRAARLRRNLSLVTGVAVLLAGALSVAMGEWISVQSSRELYAYCGLRSGMRQLAVGLAAAGRAGGDPAKAGLSVARFRALAGIAESRPAARRMRRPR